VSLAARLDALEPRERKLLNALVVVFVVMVVFVLPIGLRALLLAGTERNEKLSEAIAAIRDQRSTLARRDAEAARIAARYARPAPPLAEFLESVAKRQEISIPESQDRPAVPHGKMFEERSNRIVLRRVGLLALAKFMEAIEQSGHPVTVSELTLNKRGPDAYDVTMVVSAFDRKEAPGGEAKPAAGTETDEPASEEVAQ
jgi:general secretion pathway protein M